MAVISLRLKEKDFRRLSELSEMSHKDKSTVARELLEYGWEFLMIQHYREGKISLSALAAKLDLSVGETIELLARFGVESPLDFDDYLKGFEALK
jgi:predicted HTH domain antitoxin